MHARQPARPERFRAQSGLCAAAIATFALGCSAADPPEVPPDAAVLDAPAPVDAALMNDAPPAIDAGMADVPTTMPVLGTSTLVDITDMGNLEGLEDLTGAMFASFTPIASGLERRSVEGRADGTFALPVGLGARVWQVELGAGERFPRLFLVGNQTRLDLRALRLGRPDKRSASLPTPVTVNATGLAPWQAPDELGILSSNAGALVLDIEASAPLAGGDTALTGHVIPWSARLIDAAKGDVTMMFQLVSKTFGAGIPGSYVALARSGTAAGFTMVDGAPATLAVALAAVPASSTVTVDVKRSQFERLRAQVGPGALPAETFQQSIFIFALPQARRLGFFADAPRLVVAFPEAGTADYQRTFSYGNPFKTGGVPWDEFAVARHDFALPVLAAGATTPVDVRVGFTAHLPIATLAVDGTIAPVLTPVRNVKVAGKNVATPQAGVGLTPTITWDPPSRGTPTSYFVDIRRVTAQGAATAVPSVATFTATTTSLQVPEGVLGRGASYILVIEASASADYDPAQPFANGGLPRFSAQSATAQFKP